MERLCFGTFIDVLLHCRKERVSKKKLTGTIIKTIDPDSKYMDVDCKIDRELNHLYKCDGDFSPTFSNIIQLANEVKKDDVVQHFEGEVIQLIDIDKRKQAILTLLDIIKKDATLNYESGGENVVKFESYIGKKIKDLLNNNEYILSEFLSGIFLYSVIEIKNTVGKEWLTFISSNHEKYNNFFVNYVNSFKDDISTIQVWDTTADYKAGQKAKKKAELKGKQEAKQLKKITSPVIQNPERMFDVCRESFEGFPIKDFIDSNPADSIKSYLIQDAFTVVKRIRQKHVNGDSSDKHSEIYQNIVKFADALLEYLKFLKSASGNLNILDEGFKPLNGDDNEFVEETNHYRQQLKLLYQIIIIEIEKEEIEYNEQQRAAHKEAWEKNKQAGSL